MADRLAKEAQRGGSIPLGRQQKVDSLPGRIDCSVQIFPLSFDFDIAKST